MEPILVLLLVVAGETVAVLILMGWLGQARTQQSELIGRISYLESQIHQIELSMTNQRRYGANQPGGWGWLLALGGLIAFVAFVLLT